MKLNARQSNFPSFKLVDMGHVQAVSNVHDAINGERPVSATASGSTIAASDFGAFRPSKPRSSASSSDINHCYDEASEENKSAPRDEEKFIPGNPRRNSTMETTASAPLEATAVWDRKAILSLGRFCAPDQILLVGLHWFSSHQMAEVFEAILPF